MSEESSSLKSEFPVEINVGQKVPDYSSMKASTEGAPETPKKSKTVFPSLYVDGGADLAKIPKSGYALIKFKRRSIRIGEGGGPMVSGPGDDSKKERASVELEVQEFCLPQSAGGDIKDAFADFAKKKGVDTEGAGGEEAPDTDQEPDADEGDGEEETT